MNSERLRAEEVGTLKSYINVNHTEKERWCPPLVDYDWYAFCQALYRGIEGEDWGEMYDAYQEMSRAVAVKKPHEAQKAKALWKMKAAKDAGEENNRSHAGRNKTRVVLWEDHLKDPIVTLDKALKCVEKSVLEGVGPSAWWKERSCNGGRWLPPKFVGKTYIGRAFGPTWIRWTVCVYAQRPWSGMCQESTGRTASSFSSWFRRSRR